MRNQEILMPEPQKKILLVEDEVLIAMSEAELLNQNGYNAVIAHNGSFAIEKALSEESFDLILMDIDLGHGMDGTVAAKEILSVKSIPIIFLSNHIEQDFVKKTEEITSLGYITKTSGEAVLISSIVNAFKLIEAYKTIASRDKALTESEELFRSAFNNSSIGMAHIANNGEFIRTNFKFREIFEYSENDITNLTFKDIIRTEENNESTDILRKLISGAIDNYETELTVKRKDNMEININLTVSRSSSAKDKNGYIIATAENISARKNAEKRLLKVESMYNLISENSNDVIWVFNPDKYKFVYISPSVFKLRGYTANEIINQPLEKSVTPESLKIIQNTIADSVHKYKKGNASAHIATVFIDQPHKNGSIIHTEVVMNLVTDIDGHIKSIIGITRDISSRFIAECELKKSHLLLKRAQSIARIGYWEINLSNMTVTSSDEATEIYGLHENRLPISVIQEIPLPEYRGLLDEKLKKLIEGTDIYDIEFKIKRYDNGGIVDIHAIAQYDPSQKIVFGIIQDITELKRTQEKLRISEERYRRISDIILDYIYSVKIENGRVVETIHTPACFSVTGYSSAEFNSDPYLWYKMVHNEDRAIVETASQKIFAGENVVSFTHRIVKRDGTLRCVKSTIVARKNDAEILTGYDGLVEDITDQRNMEEALRLEEKKYRNLVENMIDVHWQTDRELVYTYISPTDKLQRGFESKELIGHALFEFMTPESVEIVKQIAAERRNQLEKGELIKSIHFIIQQYKKSGETFWCEVLSNPIYDPSGVLIGFQGITRDIHTRKLAEMALEKAVKEKEELLRELNHRVKNSLSMITGLISLEKNQTENTVVKKAFESLRSRVLTIANLYSTLDTKDNAKYISLDRYLKTIADSIKTSYAPDSKDIIIETDFTSISIDVKRAATLGLILNELLTNAFKYAFVDQKGKASVFLRKESGNLILEIIDNGNGLPKNFDITKQNGIGMKLIQMFAEQMEGSVTSSSKKPTTFTVSIPLRQKT
jgi:PAS domain S-box-containing protein